MSYDAEKLALLSDKDLAALESNVRRLAVSGTAAQRAEAERVGLLIDDERLTRKPPPAAKAPAKKRAKKAAES